MFKSLYPGIQKVNLRVKSYTLPAGIFDKTQYCEYFNELITTDLKI